MKHNDLVEMAKIGSELLNELAHKHEEGEFLRDITSKDPHSHKKTQALLHSYCDLIAQLNGILRKTKKPLRIAEFEVWKEQLEKSRNLEMKL